HMPAINFTTVKEFATASKDSLVNLATNCALGTYGYAKDRLVAVQTKITPYVPRLIQGAETAGAVVIGTIALRALVKLSNHLPVVDMTAVSIVAGYALTQPKQCSQAVTLYAIGSLIGKKLVSTCSLSVMQGFALSVATIAIANHLAKSGKHDEEKI
ncbi:MAG: hypothetical protein ACRCSV_02695, partial [Chlamydiales bacterium]